MVTEKKFNFLLCILQDISLNLQSIVTVLVSMNENNSPRKLSPEDYDNAEVITGRLLDGAEWSINHEPDIWNDDYEPKS